MIHGRAGMVQALACGAALPACPVAVTAVDGTVLAAWAAVPSWAAAAGWWW